MTIHLSSPVGLTPRPAPAAARLESLVTVVDSLVAATTWSPSAALPQPALADEIIALQRQINRLDALLLERLAAFDATGGAEALAGTTTASWLRHRTGLPAGAACDVVRTARALRDELPATRDALQRGDVTTQHARTITSTLRKAVGQAGAEQVDEVGHEVERVMLDVARSVDAGSLRGFGQRVRQIIDPDGALADANRSHERRWLTVATTLDGMVSLEGLLDSQAGATVLTVLAAGSVPSGPDDVRSGGQRRADALVEVCRQHLDGGRAGSTGGVTPHVLVTASLQSLQSLPSPEAGAPPAELEWTGSIPPETARRLACDATITRVLLDPRGLPLDIGRSTRVISPAIRTALVVRDSGCVADCCDRPPAWTEAHHVVHWIDGGSTALSNLVLLCRTHHRRVHEAGWLLDHRDGRWHVRPP